jgi:hypothetical protein
VRQLKEQQTQLQSYKEMRPRLALQNAESATGLESQLRDQRTQFKLSREQLEERHRQQKAVVADLEKQLSDARGAQNGQKQEFDRLKADYQAERDKVDALKTQLDQEETRLRELAR